MGEVVIMKKLFSHENFVFSSLDAKQKKQSLIVTGLLILLFIISSFTFFNMFYGFVDCIGSIVSGSADVAIKDFLRSVPLYLTFFMTLWSLLTVHAYFRNESEERRARSLKKNSIAVACFGIVNVLYVIIGRIAGKYLSLVEGSPSPLYPLDSILYSLLFIALACLAYFYLPKLEKEKPYLVISRGPIVTKARFVYCLFISLWMLFALFSFSAFTFGLFIVDFKHGYVFYSIALLLAYCLNVCFFAVWELYYNELEPYKRKELLFTLSLIGLCASVIVAALYFIALGLNLDGPSNIGFGILPVAFAASVNIATMLTVLLPFIVSIVALIKGLKARKE